MLGKLFNLTSATAGSPAGTAEQLESPYSPPRLAPASVQEEIHTRSLLFPDSQALYCRQDQVFPLSTSSALAPSASAAFDYDGDLDLEAQDVRVIVMQDSLGPVNPCLLFDSHPGPVTSPTGERNPPTDLRRSPMSPRKTSLGLSTRTSGLQTDSSQSRRGAFDRRPSGQGRTYYHSESDSQRAAREYREELSNFTNCIFANTEVMSYKGTSTKVHIIPTDPRSEMSSYLGDGRNSLGRSAMRSSRLSHSFTSESATGPLSVNPVPRHAERRKILVTRLFPVHVPEDEAESPARHHSEDLGGFPFPRAVDESAPKKKSQPQQRRTPMYAVALVLNLPPNHAPSSGAGSKTPFRGSGSYTEQDSFPSAFSSPRRSGWETGTDSFESSYSNENDDRMDAITQHWDIIIRTLTHLQSVVATALAPLLKQADSSAPDPPPSVAAAQVARRASLSGRRGSNASQVKPPKTNAKLLTLPQNCLMSDQKINREVDEARTRIVLGLRAARVITGQGRWGPWREEARWVARWAGGKEHSFFFYNLLAGFLATHTEWLQALGPLEYRKRYYQQQKSKSDEDASLPSRTIIVSRDKIAARRLLFLLSAFLPANQQLPTLRSNRPATSASFSHSPPSYIVPILKEESLRRKINRRPAVPRGTAHSRSFSIQSQTTTRSATGIPAQLAHLSMETSRERRPSTTDLFKHSGLPVPGNDLNNRKSSAATTNTVTPDAAIPHFSTVHRSNSRRNQRPGSSTSVAADDLKRTLSRVDSIGHASAASTDSQGRWSIISGLWGAKRRGSAASTSHIFDAPPNRDSPLSSPVKSSSGRDKLLEMVREAQTLDSTMLQQPESGVCTPTSTDGHPDTPRTVESQTRDTTVRTPGHLTPSEASVKTSFNADDGVIDVDVQFPDYLTSFDSAISSPSSSGYLSTPGLGIGLDTFEPFSGLAVDGDAPLNAAGWLQQYHPDFVLQAVPPQDDLLDRVKDSLVAEPTPAIQGHALPEDWPSERWVNVSSAIIADTTDFTVRRLRFRRLVRPKSDSRRGSGQHLSSGTSQYSSSLMTPALSPYDQPLEQMMEEELLFTLDEDLTKAVEKVIGAIDHQSGVPEAQTTNGGDHEDAHEHLAPGDEVELSPKSQRKPRSKVQEVSRAECKTVILGALDSIVRDVAAERERPVSPATSKATHNPSKGKESLLRTAVGTWLENVELEDSI